MEIQEQFSPPASQTAPVTVAPPAKGNGSHPLHR